MQLDTCGTQAEVPDSFTGTWLQRRALWLLSAALLCSGSLLAAAGPASAKEAKVVQCRALEELGATRIYDYNDPASASGIALVESYHFNTDVQTLRKGQSSTVPGDLSFVLRAIPNHYPALIAMGRWQLQQGDPRQSSGSVEPADCYFLRAIGFRPNDPRLHAVYGVYLHRARRLTEAAREYAAAEALGASDAEFYYNYGLLLVDTGDITRARAYADKAYALGHPLPGLRNKLAAKPGQ